MDGLALILGFLISVIFCAGCVYLYPCVQGIQCTVGQTEKISDSRFSDSRDLSGRPGIFYGLSRFTFNIIASRASPGNDFCISPDWRVLSSDANLSARGGCQGWREDNQCAIRLAGYFYFLRNHIWNCFYYIGFFLFEFPGNKRIFSFYNLHASGSRILYSMGIAGLARSLQGRFQDIQCE